MIYLLFDSEENKVIAIIRTSYTTREEIENIIGKLKEEVEDYTDLVLIDRLPDDCSVTWVFDKDYIIW